MNKTTIIAVVAMLTTQVLFSQVFFYCDGNSDIHEYDLLNCRDSTIIDVQSNGIILTDITYAPDNNLYGSTLEGKLYKIDPQNGVLTQIIDWCPNGFCSITSLVSDADGNIYAAGYDVYVYNIYTELASHLGSFPANIVAAGDMAFLDGILFVATTSNEIAQIDLNHPENSQTLFGFNSNQWILGISTFFVSCDSSILIGSGQFGAVFFINIEEETVTLNTCNVSTSQVFGLATPKEYLASKCSLSLDLDGDDSSGHINGEFAFATCLLPTALVDTDIVLQSGYFIDSIVIDTSYFGSLADLPFEYLAAGTAPNITVLGSGTNRLVLVNQGTATDEDFKAALLSIRYHNTATPFQTVGEDKEYTITVWSQGAGTQLAKQVRFLISGLPIFSLGEDTTVCLGINLELVHPWSPFIGSNVATVWQDGSTSNSFVVTTPGVYAATVTFNGWQGCIGSDTIVVNAGQPIFTQDAIQLCSGESIAINGQSITNDTIICTTYSAFSGCDSTRCTEITFLPQVQSQVLASICQGQTYPFNGQSLSQPGTYLDTIPNPNGCDTVLQLVLSVLPNSAAMLDSTICQGASVNIGGQSFSTSGIHPVILSAQNGCDSAIILNLHVFQNTASNISATICNGSSYTIGGMSFSAPGIYTVHLQNWQGCDSTITLSLTLQQVIAISLDTAICQGQSVIFGGQAIAQAGTYNYVATSPNACDTAYTLNLVLLPLPTASIKQSEDGCAAVSVRLTAIVGPSIVSFSWSNAATTPEISAIANGTYAVTISDIAGCTAETSTIVALPEPISAAIVASPPSCPVNLDGWLEVLNENGGVPPYSYSLNGGLATSFPVFEQLPGGAYQVMVTDASGCHWDTLVVITEPLAFSLDAGPDLTIRLGESAQLNVNANMPIDSVWWAPADYLNCPICPNTTANPIEDVEYRVFAMDGNGCVAKDVITVIVLPVQGVENSSVFVPNVFSPNGDGINDSFIVFGGADVEVIDYFKVFDRWGDLVFHAETLAPGTVAQGWDGMYRGRNANIGVYAWLAVVTLSDGSKLTLAGDVALAR